VVAVQEAKGPIRDWLHSDALHERLSRMDDRDTLNAIAWMW
jgi:hypothetical protein